MVISLSLKGRRRIDTYGWYDVGLSDVKQSGNGLVVKERFTRMSQTGTRQLSARVGRSIKRRLS